MNVYEKDTDIERKGHSNKGIKIFSSQQIFNETEKYILQCDLTHYGGM